MPLNATCNLSFTLPSIYLSDVIPTNSFQTYDQIDAVINSPRTGDLRMSLNSFYPFGWLPMNGGTIGDSSSNATTRAKADAWPLYYMLWTSFNKFGFSALPIYTSAGGNSTYGASALEDWSANKAIALTKAMGQVLMGTVPFAALLPGYKQTFAGASVTITPSGTMSLFNGAPVVFTGTTTLSTSTIYYVGNWNGTTFSVYTSFANAITLTGAQGVDASGTVALAEAGTYEGEYVHTQLTTELVAHTHTYNTIGAGAGGLSGPGAVVQVSSNTGSTGGGTAFNVTQPSVLTNIYIKL
jgi:hypothetical protein